MGVQEPIRGYRDFTVRGHERSGQGEKRIKQSSTSLRYKLDDTSSRPCVAPYLQGQLQDNLFSAQRSYQKEGAVAHWTGGFFADDRGSACECGLSTLPAAVLMLSILRENVSISEVLDFV